jgi:hypothetical protein
MKKSNSPMGVSEWMEHGKKYGYWNFFVGCKTEELKDKIKTDLLKIADTGELEELRREVSNYFDKK